MKKNQKTVRFLTCAKGNRFLLLGLSATMLSLSSPMMAESLVGEAVRELYRSISQQ